MNMSDLERSACLSHLGQKIKIPEISDMVQISWLQSTYKFVFGSQKIEDEGRARQR